MAVAHGRHLCICAQRLAAVALVTVLNAGEREALVAAVLRTELAGEPTLEVNLVEDALAVVDVARGRGERAVRHGRGRQQERERPHGVGIAG